MHRVSLLNNQFEPALTSNAAAPTAPATGKKDSLSVTDNRTGKYTNYRLMKKSIGKTYELPIKDGAINATDLAKIKDA
jgi:citrate synthase